MYIVTECTESVHSVQRVYIVYICIYREAGCFGSAELLCGSVSWLANRFLWRREDKRTNRQRGHLGQIHWQKRKGKLRQIWIRQKQRQRQAKDKGIDRILMVSENYVYGRLHQRFCFQSLARLFEVFVILLYLYLYVCTFAFVPLCICILAYY